eukprot:gene30334-37531_t
MHSTENKKDIGEIFVTLDSHHKKHIAHQAFWSNKENDKEGTGESPPLYSKILSSQIGSEWHPRDVSLKIGTVGHSIQDGIQEAITEWCEENFTKTVKHIFKGMNCLTEMYSAIEAEVPMKTDPTTTKNEELLMELKKSKRLIVCGQALSHCVNYTVRDIAADWDKDKLRQIYVIQDCSSPVTGYHEDGQTFLREIEALGCTVTTMDKALDNLPAEELQKWK